MVANQMSASPNFHRSRIVYEMLCTTTFGREKKGEVGVSMLIDSGAFTGAFPLHDVSIKG